MKFEGKLNYPCYEDEDGNIISIIAHPEQKEIFLVACISKEGDVEHIEAFESEENAVDMLHDYCASNGYDLVEKPKLGYAFTW